jgi:glucuronoarabinoxylan endo-1,4-beta-xylanase
MFREAGPVKIRTVVVALLTGSFLPLALLGCSGTSSNNSTTSTTSSPVPATLATTTTLAASPNPAPAGTAVLLVATVTASSGTPSGSVTFLDGTTTLGSVALSGGAASLSITTFAAGSTQNVSASYGGTTGFAASTSTSTVVTVQPAAPLIPITATATFSFSTSNQTISGFGGSEAFYLSYLDQHPFQSQIYTALFDPVQGLGLTYLRLQNLYYQFTGSNQTSFDPDTPLVVKAANAAHGSPLTLVMSSWSPPATLKSNGSVNNGGTLATVNGGYNYAGFGQFWYNSLTAYAALGVSPTYISIQNEPDYTATYASCRFNPTEATYNGSNYAGYGLAFSAVYNALRALSSPPKMLGPETFSAVNFLDMAAQIPVSEVSSYAHHLYNVSSTSTNPDSGLASLTALNAAYPTAMKFMTEYYASPGINDAWDIHNALTVANDNAYFYWGLAWPSSSVANGQASDEQGLLYIDNPFNAQSTWAFSHGWTYNDSYYALKHFSFYVRPGYIRYNASVTNTDERVSVYQSADQKTTVIVAMNLSASATDGLSLNLANVTYTASMVYRSTFSTPIATGERWANLGAYSSNGLSLPPQSVATIVLTR